jgi:hypothetical protein
MRIACTLTLFLLVTPVAGATFEVDRESLLCRTVLSYLNQSKSINRAVWLSGFKAIPFRPASLSFQVTAEGSQLTESVEAAHFDIDNDGTPELVVKYQTWLRNRPGDLLWIFPKTTTIDINALPHLTPEEFGRMEAVEPMSPWPYADRGIHFADIAALVQDGVTYLSLRDTLFGNPKFPDRRWLIAKYSGHGIRSTGYHAFTDDLETVCAFRYSRR